MQLQYEVGASTYIAQPGHAVPTLTKVLFLSLTFYAQKGNLALIVTLKKAIRLNAAGKEPIP